MMITPKFRVEQDFDNLYVIIRMANCRSLWSENSIEIFHQNNEFIFFGKPSYYLRLELPGEVISSDTIIADEDLLKQQQLKNIQFNYDSETNELKIPVEKKNPGEHFENLEILEQLLAKSKTKPGKKLIQVLQNNKQNDQESNEDEEEEIEDSSEDGDEDASSQSDSDDSDDGEFDVK